MANQEHLDKLKEGVENWNAWRHNNKNIPLHLNIADFSGASLSGASLSGANLVNSDFSYADLRGANLKNADLSDTFLNGANLRDVNFKNASLKRSFLNGADLREADLRGADLRGADLSYANFIGAKLAETILSDARVEWSIFGNVDLSLARGLETIRHNAPSTIGIDTIYRSHGNIPEIFLKGVGIDDTFITYIRSLVGSAIEYYSCFISYSSKDDPLAKRLYADLQSHNVRCWFAPEDLKWGEKIRTGIDEAIRLHDKLLLILSKSSVASGWVEHEVEAALAKERKEKRVTLFPVRVDKAVLDSPLSWAAEIRRERNIGDFTRWKTHDEYEKAFARLLRDLKQTEGKGE